MSLLRVDVRVEGGAHLCEHVRAVEFVVQNTKKSVGWPQPWQQQSPASATTTTMIAAPSKVVTLDDVTVEEREFGPSLLFYAPLGGRFSKEFRALLLRGLVRVLTQLALRQLDEQERGTGGVRAACLGRCAAGSDVVDGTEGNALEQYISVRRDARNTQVARVHWSPQLLHFLLTDAAAAAAAGTLQFTARMPWVRTLIPLMDGFRAPAATTASNHKSHDDGGSGDENGINKKDEHKSCRLVFTIERLELVQQSVHDECIADRLASILFHSYLKPADQMREAGGESLQAPLMHPHDALGCYRRALELAQGGLLYPYRHALRPPPSLEDRVEDVTDDDICDQRMADNGERVITPANRDLRVLLLLRKNEGDDENNLESLYREPLLEEGRLMFPHAHAFLHVWYALHRQVVVAASNAAHALLLTQPCATPGTSSMEGYGLKELQKQQMRAARWCGRALVILGRLRDWWSDVVFREAVKGSDVGKEWLWSYTIMFKLLVRRGKLLRVSGVLDECQKAQEETEEQLRLLSARPTPLCCDGIHRVVEDVRRQLAQEKSLLRSERNQKCGLVLRL